MIEIKYEILPLVIVGFVLKMIYPVLEINDIDPNLVAALRVNNVDLSLFSFPIVYSNSPH